jgi:hypothetical protein
VARNRDRHNMNKIIVAAAAVGLALAISGPSFAAGKKAGFATETVNTTGGSTKYNPNASTSSTTTVTTTGPKGQLQNDKTANVSSGKTNRPGPNMP